MKEDGRRSEQVAEVSDGLKTGVEGSLGWIGEGSVRCCS